MTCGINNLIITEVNLSVKNVYDFCFHDIPKAILWEKQSKIEN